MSSARAIKIWSDDTSSYICAASATTASKGSLGPSHSEHKCGSASVCAARRAEVAAARACPAA
eukprot:1905739-Alexandrium_andersonii.AAC.1